MLRLITILLLWAIAAHASAQWEKKERKVRTALATGEPYRAIRFCDHHLLDASAPAVFRMLRADAFNRIGQHDRALADADIALAADPGDAEALLQAGIALAELGRTDSALVRLNATMAAATEPALYTDACVRAATVYQRLQRTSLALIALAPPAKPNAHDNDPRVHRIRGECLALQGDSAGARAAFDRALELAPRDPVLWNSRGFYRYAHFGEHERAIMDYDRAIKLNPNYGYAFNNRGWSRYKLGRKDDALDDIALAGRKNKQNAFVYRNLGVIALESGDTAKACACFERAMADGFTERHGGEVKELAAAHCTNRVNAPVPNHAPAPVNAPTRPPQRTNAP